MFGTLTAVDTVSDPLLKINSPKVNGTSYLDPGNVVPDVSPKTGSRDAKILVDVSLLY